MAVLKNPRHERFAQELAKGKTADEAYVIAGYKESRAAASRLSAKINIRSRIEQIQSRISEKAEWTAADRLASLKEIHEATKEKDQRIAIAAIAEANKMQGSHAPAKHHLAGAIGTYDPAKLRNLSDDELDRLTAIVSTIAASDGSDGGESEA